MVSQVVLIPSLLAPVLLLSQRAGQMGELPQGPGADCKLMVRNENMHRAPLQSSTVRLSISVFWYVAFSLRTLGLNRHRTSTLSLNRVGWLFDGRFVRVSHKIPYPRSFGSFGLHPLVEF